MKYLNYVAEVDENILCVNSPLQKTYDKLKRAPVGKGEIIQFYRIWVIQKMARESKKLSTEDAILERRALHFGTRAGCLNLKTILSDF